MKKILLTFSLLVAGIGATFGQSKIWVPYNINVDTSWGIRYISAIDTNIIWGIAYDNANATTNTNTFVRTTNSGLSFRKGNIFPNSGTFSISNISAVDSSIAFVAAYDSAGDGTSGRIMKTIDGGLHWTVTSDTTKMFVGGANFPDFVHFWDKNNGLALGDPNGNTGGGAKSEFEIWRTHDGGATWTRVVDANIPPPVNGEYGLTNSYETYGKRMWFGTQKGRVYSSLDSGQTWTVNTGNIGIAGGIGTLAFRDSLNGLALGLATAAATANNAISKTADGGKTWTAVTIDPIRTGMNDICRVPGRNAYMSVGATGNNIPFVTSVSYDDATTWNLLDSGSNFSFDMLQAVMFDSAHGWGGTIADASLPLGKNGMDKYRGPKIALACPINILATKSLICLNDSSTLTANGTTTFTWTSPSVNTASVTVKPTTSTVYTVTGSIPGCTNTQTFSITVNQVANPTVTVNNSDTVCTGGTTVLIAHGNATTYSWTPAAGLTPPVNTSAVFAKPAVTTVYSVKASVGACYTTASHTVTVLSTPSPTLTVNTPTICAGSTATLTAGGFNTYAWSPAGGLSAATGASVTGTPTVTTTYTLTAVDAAHICKTAAKARIIVNQNPTVTVVNAHSFTVCVNGSTTLNGGGAASYTWSPATGLSSTSGSAVTATVSATPSATVVYTVTGSSNGCIGTATATLTVNACTGIAKISNPNNVTMYPNPSAGVVNITMDQLNAGTMLSVTDMIGKEVYKTSVQETNLSLDLTGLQKGMYIITIGSGNAAYMQKLIIQ